jgi:predicted nucleic acid-binding protein
MAIFVVDASAALAWCFEDEAQSRTDELLERLRQGDRIVVRAHWPTEVLNGLLVAARRKRIKPDQPVLFWEELSRLPTETEPPLTAIRAKTVPALSDKHSLTGYDAVYLELAHRRQLSLGTLDRDLRNAAQMESVPVL